METQVPVYFVNFIKKLSAEDYPTDLETAIWLSKGYEIVTKRTYFDCRERFFKHHQARIRKSMLQRLRRANGGK